MPGTNTGYAGGAALGMERAIAAGADYVAIVTQDTEVESSWLRELVAVAERYPTAGAVQPKLLRPDGSGRLVINSWGTELTFSGVGYPGGDGAPDRPLDVREITCASGAGALYRRDALAAVGVMDRELFMYHEDTDLGWRLRLAGYIALLAPRAVMVHRYEFKRSAGKFYWLERNRLINLLTHYRLRTIALLSPALLLLEAATLAHALTEGWLRRRLAVYAFFLRPRAWRYLRRKRRRVQSLRRVPDLVIAARLTGRVESVALDGVGLRLLNLVLGGYWRLARRVIVW